MMINEQEVSHVVAALVSSTDRIDTRSQRRAFLQLIIYSLGISLSSMSATWAQSPSPSVAANAGPVTGFSNVRIFDGKSGKLFAPSNVLVRGNVIEKISDKPIPTDRRADTVLIDGGGRTLMPGLIDAHWHAMLATTPLNVLMTVDDGYLNLLAGREAERTLMRGFTTIRDLGGPTFGLKRAIDEGVVVGPRIYPSGAMITITGGHGDFRQPYELPRTLGAPTTRTEEWAAA
jgi:imidazolonepropionase-like amidohydrolase